MISAGLNLRAIIHSLRKGNFMIWITRWVSDMRVKKEWKETKQQKNYEGLCYTRICFPKLSPSSTEMEKSCLYTPTNPVEIEQWLLQVFQSGKEKKKEGSIACMIDRAGHCGFYEIDPSCTRTTTCLRVQRIVSEEKVFINFSRKKRFWYKLEARWDLSGEY